MNIANNVDPKEMARFQQMIQRIKELQEQLRANDASGNKQANQLIYPELTQLSQQAQQFIRSHQQNNNANNTANTGTTNSNQQQPQQRQNTAPMAPSQTPNSISGQQHLPHQNMSSNIGNNSASLPTTPLSCNDSVSSAQPLEASAQNNQQNYQISDAQKKQNLQIQTDLFVKTLHDFLKAQNKQVNPNSFLIDNKPINLFLMYFLVNKMGGFQSITSNNQWEIVAMRLNLSSPNNPNHSRIALQLFNFYQEYIMQFDIYLKTPEGQKLLESNKKEKIMELHQRNQPQSQNQPSKPEPDQPQQNQLQAQSEPRQQQPQPSQVYPFPQNIQASPNGFQSMPPPSSVQTLSNPNTPQIPPNYNLRPPSSASNTNPSSPSASTANMTVDSMTEYSKEDPVFIRKYDPMVRSTSMHHAGLSVKKLLAIGDQFEPLKPNYLFPPETGNLDIHALTMSLQSYSLSEVNNVLNMLLVMTSDPRIDITISECQELLDRLSELGLSILDELVFDQLNKDNVKYDESIYEERSKKRKSWNSDSGINHRKKRIFKQESFIIDEVYKISPYDKYYFSSIDDEFVSYVSKHKDEKEVVITVDSFTGAEVPSENSSNSETVFEDHTEGKLAGEIHAFLNPNTFKRYARKRDIYRHDRLEKFKDHSFESHITKFKLPPYMDLLMLCNEEMDETFSEVNIRASEKYQIMLVDQITTISMIARNFSFIESNKSFLKDNRLFKRFVFSLLFACFAFDEFFVYSRRKLAITKDCLITLMNIGHSLRLDDFTDALLIVALTLQFGGSTSKDPSEINKNLLPEYIPSFEKYQCYAVDMFTKVLANSRENRLLIKCVLTGNYQRDVVQFKPLPSKNKRIEEDTEVDEDFDSIDNDAFFNNLGLPIGDESITDNLAYKLSEFYIKDMFKEATKPESCILVTKMFGYMMGVLPSSTYDTLAIEEKTPIIIQSLLSANLLVKMIPVHSGVSKNVSLEWITSHELVGGNLIRLGLMMTPIRAEKGKEFLPLIASRSLMTVNLLLEKVFQFIDMSVSLGKSDEEDCIQLAKLPRIVPTHDAILGTILSGNIDSSILKEVLKLASHSKKLNDSLLKFQDNKG
ncbi:Swi1 protein [Saccharomycopsis crataegensis]|uniref:Swi1 protein n=1 Tax=Saccharomycopsis crataegensis TaxID=43959 RepID=A0AAV5QT78_9ASCO|nr:Swi1 protein [Saccharomycopsis crataegensis]